MFLLKLFILVTPSWGVSLKGKPLNHQKFSAELALDKGKPVKGSVRFRKGKQASFRAYDGTEVPIRIRPLCAAGPHEEVDSCWPKLLVEMDDLSSRSGTLVILGGS